MLSTLDATDSLLGTAHLTSHLISGETCVNSHFKTYNNYCNTLTYYSTLTPLLTVVLVAIYTFRVLLIRITGSARASDCLV